MFPESVSNKKVGEGITNTNLLEDWSVSFLKEFTFYLE